MSSPVVVRVRQLSSALGLPLPSPASTGAAGADLRAAIEGEISLAPGGRAGIPTGLVLQIPHGWEGQVRPRSGLARSYGVTLLNSPGTIDSDYRGEVVVILVNHGDEPYVVRRGDRIAQLVVAPVALARFDAVDELGVTDRGEGGFGSTGMD